MLLNVLRVAGALVASFVVRGTLTSGFHRVLGRRILNASPGWMPGAPPPMIFVVANVASSTLASIVGGVLVGLIVRKHSVAYAAAFGVLFFVLAFNASPNLLSNPHPEEWPLVLSPLTMPLGAWLLSRQNQKRARLSSAGAPRAL